MTDGVAVSGTGELARDDLAGDDLAGDPHAAVRCRLQERGFLTVEYVVVIGFALVLFTLLANLIVYQYGRGVVRAAVDEAARAGSRTGVAACERRGSSALDGMLGGTMGDGLSLVCQQTDSRVVARVSGRFEGWLPLVPALRVEASGVARREAAP